MKLDLGSINKCLVKYSKYQIHMQLNKIRKKQIVLLVSRFWWIFPKGYSFDEGKYFYYSSFVE